jgi:hypothetical protein
MVTKKTQASLQVWLDDPALNMQEMESLFVTD